MKKNPDIKEKKTALAKPEKAAKPKKNKENVFSEEAEKETKTAPKKPRKSSASKDERTPEPVKEEKAKAPAEKKPRKSGKAEMAAEEKPVTKKKSPKMVAAEPDSITEPEPKRTRKAVASSQESDQEKLIENKTKSNAVMTSKAEPAAKKPTKAEVAAEKKEPPAKNGATTRKAKAARSAGTETEKNTTPSQVLPPEMEKKTSKSVRKTKKTAQDANPETIAVTQETPVSSPAAAEKPKRRRKPATESDIPVPTDETPVEQPAIQPDLDTNAETSAKETSVLPPHKETKHRKSKAEQKIEAAKEKAASEPKPEKDIKSEAVIAALRKEGYRVEDEHGVLYMLVDSRDEFNTLQDQYTEIMRAAGWNRSCGIRVSKEKGTHIAEGTESSGISTESVEDE